MGKPLLFGADYSVYVRIARLALVEKGVDHDLVPVDVFAEGGSTPYLLEKYGLTADAVVAAFRRARAKAAR